MSHTNHHLWYHVVWSTKHRKPLFTKTSWKEYVGPTLFEIAQKQHAEKCFINGYADHVHVLVRLGTLESIGNFTNVLKGVSSRTFNKEDYFESPFGWQNGYYVCTVSPDRVESVKNYIKNQWEKHEQLSFQNEIKLLTPVS